MYALDIAWNPSKGIDLGFFTLHYYSVMWIVAFLIGFYIVKRIFKNENQTNEAVDSLFIYSVIGIMLGARLGHVFFYQPELINDDFFSIFLPFKFKGGIEFTGFQGLASHGAAIGMIISMYLFNKKIVKKSVLWVLDRVVVPVSLGAVFVRLGNFINSEIIGKVTESSFGVRFIQDTYNKYEVVRITGIENVKDAYVALGSDPKYTELLEQVPFRHPAQLYEAFSYVFVFFILMYVYWKTEKSKQQGFLFGLFLVLLWTVRFVVEYVKEPQNIERTDWLLNTGQLLSIPFVLIGLYFMFVYKAKRKLS
ncbi:prolipoprotein diacylglyceryl transferase [Psychroserpens ponticola]|uniref:Phosphatidylglycerol--prolipoprotein diacylglyceryl transferase n=1 Tax=Psychroserpens ponticola TaxID=2932268 RepID=A0ABY7RZ57_9FLAO|nr:prolipoprotein diacylglyceryl transferase [Psychroserpens ponticola]WCO02425.1 prolipoprotein diacylglyceryl transferase [Psychroserpens ponticola]